MLQVSRLQRGNDQIGQRGGPGAGRGVLSAKTEAHAHGIGLGLRVMSDNHGVCLLRSKSCDI